MYRILMFVVLAGVLVGGFYARWIVAELGLDLTAAGALTGTLFGIAANFCGSLLTGLHAD